MTGSRRRIVGQVSYGLPVSVPWPPGEWGLYRASGQGGHGTTAAIRPDYLGD